MKRLGIGFIILFFLVSCSSTGRVGTLDKSSLDDTPLVYNPADQSKLSAMATGGAAKKAKGKPKVFNPEDDDDIASLLEHDDFRDFDLPIVFNEAVKYYVVYFNTEKRKVFANWLKRSRRYVPVMKEILKQHGLPEDLVYVAMIESGFNAKAYSSAKACGPWQFIYETGGRYGLKANFWIDERRDPEKSTIAAAKYLTDLFNQFGHWYLAAAGYNAGEKRVERAIEKHNTNDFWELAKYNALPRETREYIPRLIAASIIAKDPERFGFGSIVYEDPVRFAEVKVPRATLLTAIARASSIDIAELRSLNPELLRGITPPYMEDYRVKLPASTNIARFSEALEGAGGRERKIKDVVVYKVKKKDTLAKILKKYGIREEELYLVNSCEEQLKVKPGMALNIPIFVGSTRTAVAAVVPAPVKAPARDSGEVRVAKLVRAEKQHEKPEKTEKQEKAERVEKVEKVERIEKTKGQGEPAPAKTYHVVRRGETLSDISTKYGVEVASLMSVNNLKSEKVYPNMKLMLASHHSPKKKESQAGPKFHTVKKGETLAQISSKYHVSISSLKSANNLKSLKVQPKMKLKIVSGEG